MALVMDVTMNLDDNQRKTVSGWIADGLKLSEIQKRLAEEFDLHLTYMEMRFLMDDLQLKPKDPEPPKEVEKAAPEPALASRHPDPLTTEPSSTKPTDRPQDPNDTQIVDKVTRPGDVSVTVDQVTRPGAVVSGQVTFSDGKKAGWYLDQIGRLGVLPEEPGYKPSQGDLMIFEGELQGALQKMGY